MAPDGGEVIWVNGGITPRDQAVISVLDRGFTVGQSIFETMKVIGGTNGATTPRAFALTRHLRRLHHSAEGIEVPIPDDDDLRGAVHDVLAAYADRFPHGHGRLRLTITSGVAPLDPGAPSGTPTVILIAAPLPPIAPSARLVTVTWRRNERSVLAGLKTTSYAENAVAQRHARAHGADEAILANTAGRLCEGTGTNIFLGIGGRLVTPPPSSGCLSGVTRELLLEWTGAVEEDLPYEALNDADEAFISSSTRSVQPVSAIDGVALAACPGPLTATASEQFTAGVARDLDP